MSEERRKVLELLAAGKITADDAERLLEKVSSRASASGSMTDDAGDTSPEEEETTNAVLVEERVRPWHRHRHRHRHMHRPLRFLRIVIRSKDQETVNIRVPLAFIRTGIKLTTMVPPKAVARLRDEGIDLSGLSELKGEELIEALRELKVDVDGSDGDTVRIFCE